MVICILTDIMTLVYIVIRLTNLWYDTCIILLMVHNNWYEKFIWSLHKKVIKQNMIITLISKGWVDVAFSSPSLVGNVAASEYWLRSNIDQSCAFCWSYWSSKFCRNNLQNKDSKQRSNVNIAEVEESGISFQKLHGNCQFEFIRKRQTIYSGAKGKKTEIRSVSYWRFSSRKELKSFSDHQPYVSVGTLPQISNLEPTFLWYIKLNLIAKEFETQDGTEAYKMRPILKKSSTFNMSEFMDSFLGPLTVTITRNTAFFPTNSALGKQTNTTLSIEINVPKNFRMNPYLTEESESTTLRSQKTPEIM